MSYRKKRIQRREYSTSEAFAEPALPALPRFIQRVLQNRGINCAADLDFSLKNLEQPNLLEVDRACQLLADAVRKKQRVMIVGDYDADGATSTVLAVSVLRRMGAAHVEYLVPNRFDYGYGLSPEIVEVAARSQPDLIITVDSGISCVAGVAAAKARGIRVLVTDHHLPGNELPSADAIVNPNQRGCGFLSKNTAGVGVIFYVMCALRAHLKRERWFEENQIAEPVMAEWLDLVALGTVADVVKLDKNNRILVQKGLERIRKGLARPGILMLLKVAGKDYRSVVSTDLGYFVGPRLNAAGRLDDMTIGIECLLAEDWVIAENAAARLNEFNQERRQLEQDMLALSDVMIEAIESSPQPPWGITLHDSSFHQGIVGLVASRVKDKLYRPVIVFASSETQGELKGSGRAIPGLHLRDALERISTEYPGIIKKFGGHAAAAGLSIEPARLQDFSKAFDAVVHQMMDEADLQPVVYSDGELEPSDLTLASAQCLKEVAPWGQGFPEPVFDGVFNIINGRIVGARHMKLLVMPLGSQSQTSERPNASGAAIDAIQFNSPLAGREVPRKVRMAYRLDVNRFRGETSLQLLVDYVEPL